MSDLVIRRGDTATVDGALTLNDVAVDVTTGYTSLVWTCYPSAAGVLAGSVSVTKSFTWPTTASGITIVSATAGTYRISFASTDFTSLVLATERSKDFLYKTVLTDTSGNVTTVALGKLTIRNNY